jgi:hypothetical protein
VFIDGKEICIRDRTGPVHFELEKLFPVNVLCSIKAVQYWQPNFSIGA